MRSLKWTPWLLAFSLGRPAGGKLLEKQLPILVLRGGDSSASLLDSLESLKSAVGSLQKAVKTYAQSMPDEPTRHPDPVLADPQIGDRVRVRKDVRHPKFAWGNITHESVGRLVWFEGDLCSVDFPRHARWVGLLSELELIQSAVDIPDVGDTVRVRTNTTHGFRHERGEAPVVGEVQRILVEPGGEQRELCEVRLGRRSNWTGALDEVELVQKSKKSAATSRRSQLRLPMETAFMIRPGAPTRRGAFTRRGSMSLAQQLGWALGICFAQLADAGAGTAGGNRRAAKFPLRVLAVVRPLIWFGWLLGCLLSFTSLLIDRPLSSMVDSVLDILPTVGHALMGRQGRVPGWRLPMLSRALFLAHLRLPSVLVSLFFLAIFCVRPTLANLLSDTRNGFEAGFRQLRAGEIRVHRGARPPACACLWLTGLRLAARGNAGTNSAAAEAMLSSILSSWRHAITLVHAARAATIGVGFLMLIDWALSLASTATASISSTAE